WVAALTAILDTSAVLIAGVDGPHGYQARPTFAMARHAAGHLALILRAPPSLTSPFSQSEIARPQESLRPTARQIHRGRRAGRRIREGATGAGALTELWGLYDPFARALGLYYGFPLPPFLPANPPVDNWQTSAWMQRSPGLGGLPAARTGDSHFD